MATNRVSPFGARLVCAVWFLAATFVCRAAEPDSVAPIPVQFLDSATGCSIRPDQVEIAEVASTAPEMRVAAHQFDSSGRATLELQPGPHRLVARAAGYRPGNGVIDARSVAGFRVRIFLDPEEIPSAIEPDNLARLLRPEAMLLQGFVFDESTGQPLPDAQVRCAGGEGDADANGFFRFYAPMTAEVSGVLEISRAGFQTQRRINVELWPGGDWTYRITLRPGDGILDLDECAIRRRADPSSTRTSEPRKTATARAIFPPFETSPGLLATAPTNSTVRAPRQIRVLRSDNVTIDYVSLNYYVRCVLPSEWIPSWASYTGGSNALNAGAIAARCYAIAKVNAAASSSAYDICATTSCQVYNPANINSSTDRAANFTDNWVVINSAGVIPSTEYSAENNQAGASCGDGFTAPTSGCLYDPACSGESTYGHGRGMCQWGTARWATGRRMAGRSSSDATPNGYSRRDWMWIVRHYYPTLTLIKSQPLLLGDDVRALKTLDVRACPDGSITNGSACALVTTKTSGSLGVIIGGPILVTNDSARSGFNWYKVLWSNGASGWSVENYLERMFSAPGSIPAVLTATPSATNQINLSWSDPTEAEAGFILDRATSAVGPWLRLASLGANVTNYTHKNLPAGTTWFYRVQAFNAAGAGPLSTVVSASTPGFPPVLAAISNLYVMEGSSATMQISAKASPFVHPIIDFESFPSETANGQVMFRTPRFSGSTSANLASEPDLAAVTDAFPVTGHVSQTVLRVSFNFTNLTSPWLRLSTASAAFLPNPVVDLAQTLSFEIYSDRPIRVGLGIRETSVAPGSVVGSDGGSTGGIEWIGVTNKSMGAPMPIRQVAAGVWTTLSFDLPREPALNFSGGDGVLSTPSGLGVLEHLALVPSGVGVHNIYLDSFEMSGPKTLSYVLEGAAPPGLQLDALTGILSWTPAPGSAGSTNLVTVRVRDNSVPALSATQNLTVTVLPRLALQGLELRDGVLGFSWTAIPGARYWVQSKDKIGDLGWITVGEIIPMNGKATFSEPSGSDQRYYRVLAQ